MGPPIRPVVIAHRGASGYLPEHTFAAKELAYRMGADYLEQDIVATRDDELVVLHDIHLDRITNVANLFPDRCRNDSRFYVRDFELAELRTLEVHERTNADGSPVYPGRYASDGERFRIHTFAEELELVAELISGNGRPIGIYPEIKRPVWHRKEGVDIAASFLELLGQFGYTSHSDPIYVQCFDYQELVRLRERHNCELKLIQLIGENDWGEANTDYDKLRSASGLEGLAKIADGIGPWVNHLYEREPDGRISDSGLVSRAHGVGLAVHPYTFRRDDLAPGFETFDSQLHFVIDELSVDGLFTDFPDLVIKACGER